MRLGLAWVILFLSAAVRLPVQADESLYGDVEKDAQLRLSRPVAKPGTTALDAGKPPAVRKSGIDAESFSLDNRNNVQQFRVPIQPPALMGGADNDSAKIDRDLDAFFRPLHGMLDRERAQQAKLEQPFQRRHNLRAEMDSGPAHFFGGISPADLKTLSGCDVMIILDHSGSMGDFDCPSGAVDSLETKYRWCLEEMGLFADRIVGATGGFTLITFDSHPEYFRVQSGPVLQSIMQSLKPDGGTQLDAALDLALKLHRANQQKPLLLAVVTDAEIDLNSVGHVCAAATKQLPLPNGVFITLLQVGIRAERNTEATMKALNNLTSLGAAYDACRAIPFSQVRREGLVADILKALRAQPAQ